MGPLTALGAAACLGFLVVFSIDGWTRPGYRPRRHPVSALALGPRGRVQTANFLLTGLCITAGAFGVWSAAPVLALGIAALGIALVASGIWRMDPMRGYPPGTPDTTPESYSRSHVRHDRAGAVVFVGMPVVALIAALSDLAGPVRVLSAVGLVVAVLAASRFATAWERDDPLTGRWQRIALIAGLGQLAVVFATI